MDGQQAGEGRVKATEPLVFSGDEITDVGGDSATPVSTTTARATVSSPAASAGVQIDASEDAEDADHLITAEERLRVAMARQ